MTDDVNAFLWAQGAKSYPFDNGGDKITGTIQAMEKRTQTDMTTGAVQTFQSGQPREMVVITLATEMREHEGDDGVRMIYMKGGNFEVASGRGTSGMMALRDAMVKANVKRMEIGGVLTVVHTGLGKPPKVGFNAPKLFMAKYEAPTQSMGLDDVFGEPVASATSAPQQQPAWADEEPF